MISLEKSSGLPIQMRDDYSLVFEGGLSPVTPQIREFSAMKNFLKDEIGSYWRRDVYHMYRDMFLPEHMDAVHAAKLQYDITVIPPGRMGDEFVKTIGHYHPFKPGTQIRYPEVYEVIYGKLFELLQSASPDLERLEEAYLVEVNRGEKVIVPPGFGHVSINPIDDVLVLANWQLLDNKGIYEPYESKNGAAYYVIQSERLSNSGSLSTNYEFLPNLHYNQVPPLIHARTRDFPQYDLRGALPMYQTGVKNLKALEFLVNPENYLDELTTDKLLARQNSKNEKP